MLKKYLPTSLFGRTLLIIMVPVLILQIAVSIVFFDRHWSRMTDRLAYAVAGEMAVVLDSIEAKAVHNAMSKRLEITSTITDDIDRFPQQDSDNIFYDSKDRRFASHWNYEDNIIENLSEQIHRVTDIPFQVVFRPSQKIMIVHFLYDNQLITFTVPEGRLYSSSSYIFILWMIGLSVLLFTISMLFMRNQIRPIYRLGVVAERMGRGIAVGKLKPSGAREVRQATEAFINMQDRIKQFITGRTTMLAGVSHDLRTPLTRMKLQLEMMGDSPDIDSMRADIADMERMIEGYLSFAKGDGGEEMQRVNLQNLLNKVLDDGRRLSLDVIDNRHGQDDRMIWAKSTALSRALGNFISNAAQYANTMQMDVVNDANFITIHIHDNGEGIDEVKVNDMLKPFVRGEDSRNLKTGGVGLGLTIANDIIISHGGTLKLSKSQLLGGLQVSVSLPL